MSIGRRLAIWLGSFLLAATVLIIYGHIPLGPLLLGGGITFVGTLIHAALTHRKAQSQP